MSRVTIARNSEILRTIRRVRRAWRALEARDLHRRFSTSVLGIHNEPLMSLQRYGALVDLGLFTKFPRRITKFGLCVRRHTKTKRVHMGLE